VSVSSVPRVVGHVRSAASVRRGNTLDGQHRWLSRPWAPSNRDGGPVPPSAPFYEDHGVPGLSRWEEGRFPADQAAEVEAE
jgi:hypothetical protein